jgi:hypothetical protein
MNPPSTPKPEPRTSPENEPEQVDRTARRDELLARAGQAAQRIAAHEAERHADSEYAARMELEAGPEAGPQAEVRDELELELLGDHARRFPSPIDVAAEHVRNQRRHGSSGPCHEKHQAEQPPSNVTTGGTMVGPGRTRGKVPGAN